MKTFYFYIFSAFLIVTISTKAQGAAQYEELSYEDIVQELNQKIKQSQAHLTVENKMNAGFALIGAANGRSTPNGESITSQYGFQLSFGFDLFSSQWASEIALRNFDTTMTANESKSLKEADLKVMYRQKVTDRNGYRWGGGLASRFLKIKDDSYNIDEMTPAWLMFAGFDSYLSKNWSFGIEGGLRMPMVSHSADKSSLDLMVRLDTYF